MTSSQSIKEALSAGTLQLKGLSPSARLDVEILLAFCLEKPRIYLLSYSDLKLTAEQQEAFQHCLDQRRQGMPIAYITGHKEFWSLDLEVSPSVLIPRPETELLVELTLSFLPKDKQTVLDLGTGSGAIALALASERPNWEVIASDKSEAALATATQNALRLGIRNIQFQQSNWFDEIQKQGFNAIISNPPYIAETDPHLLADGLPFEPQNALISAANGLQDLKLIIQHSQDFLISGGFLLVEHGFSQKDALLKIFEQSAFEKIQSWQDWQGQDRVCAGWKR